MILRILAAPLRLMLGLPAFYGMTVQNRVRQIGRWAGIYRGPIHSVIRARTLRIGAKVSPLSWGG